MPQTDFTDNVKIDGSRDITQLDVEANATQNDPLQQWSENGGDPLARITGDGRLQVGSFASGAMATDDSLIEAHRDEADTSKPTRGLHLLGEITGTLSNVISWIVQELVLKGTGGISALHSALRVKLTNENTGIMDTGAELRAGDFEVVNDGGSSGDGVTQVTGVRSAVTNNASGYIDTAVGVDIELADSGAITDAYGLRVSDVDQGSGDNFAIHTGKGKLHVGDAVELVELDTAPTEQSGTVQIYAKTDGKLYQKNDSGVETEIGSGGVQNKFDATVDPTVNDDSTEGYVVGSRWINVTDDRAFVCVDNGVGAAIWELQNTKIAATEPLQSTSTVTGYTISIGDSLIAPLCYGRISTSSTEPVESSDAGTVNTLYWHPLDGNAVGLYNPSSSEWELFTCAATPLSVSLSGLTADQLYFLYLYDNGGSLSLAYEQSGFPGGLSRMDGVLVKTIDPERRIVGGFIATSANATIDNLGSRMISNIYNRRVKSLATIDTTNSWTYGTTQWRPWRNNSVTSGVRFYSILPTYLDVSAQGFTGSGNGAVGIGVNSTSSNSAQIHMAGPNLPVRAEYTASIGVGEHNIYALEYATTSTTFYGDAGVSYFQTGLRGTVEV